MANFGRVHNLTSLKLIWINFNYHKCFDTIFLSLENLFKRNAQFTFLCNPQKSGAFRVCSTFLETTQKILAKDIIHKAGTDHWNSKLSTNIQPEKNNHLQTCQFSRFWLLCLCLPVFFTLLPVLKTCSRNQ